MPRPISPAAARVALAVIAVGFLASGWRAAGRQGIIAEEIQPYLPRYPHVLEEVRGQPQLMPPDEPGAPAGPRFIATSQWPVLAWQGTSRVWPILIRGHQSALASYLGIALGPLLGGGVAGVRRSSLLLGLLLIGSVWPAARRLGHGAGAALVATLVLAASFGTIWICRTGYAFEIGSRVAMMAALALAAVPRAPGRGRAAAIGALTGAAILSRATIAVALAPALAILLAAPSRRPGARRGALIVAAALAVPLGALALVAVLARLRPDAVPLAGFPITELAARTAGIPRQLALQLAFLADANVVLGPLARGEAAPGPALAPLALAGAVPFAAALVRWWRGQSGDGERMFVAAALASVTAGAWLYRDPREFQLALALEPLWALALADQLAALGAVRAPAALAGLALLGVLRGEALARGAIDFARPGNPMVSGGVQRAAAARLRALGLTGAEVVTTTYNQAGVLEAWTDGALRPVHAWPLLALGPRDVRGLAAGAALEPAWRAILRARRPRYLLLSEGSGPYDGPFTDDAAIAGGLTRAAAALGLRLIVDARFPAERGTAGWTLLRVE